MSVFAITLNQEILAAISEKLDSAFVESMDVEKQEAGISVTLHSSRVRNHFTATCDFLRLAAQNEKTQFKVLGTVCSTRYILDVTDRIQVAQNEMEMQLRTRSDEPEGWGYKLLNAISRYLPETTEDWFKGKYWFQFGTFERQGVWRVDKNQIRAILKQQAEDQFLHLCPSFDFTKTEGIIERLPDRIDTRDNPNWTVIYSKEVEGSRVYNRACGVIHKLSKSPAVDRDEAKTVSKTPPKRNIPETSFSDIGGIDNIIEQVREVVELPLKNPGLFKHLGIKPHKGVMLHGDPGCGKTMIAKAIAHEVNAHFISVKGPELINKYYGQSEENLRNLFLEAREMEPAIIFFDEIDAVAQKRSGADNLRMDARFVNQLLSLMDGIEEFGRLCVIGATNRIELIDEALLRPGRFDYRLQVKRPDAEGCFRILEITTEEMPLSPEVDKRKLSEKLKGYTGADISFMAREAAYNCMRRSLKINGSITTEDVDYESVIIEPGDFEIALQTLEESKKR